MIDHDKKIVFVHVPKCAGNAVYNAIKPGTRGEHVPLTKWYGRNIHIVEKSWSDYYKFTFVRNPWDRFVSVYHYLSNGGMNLADKRAGDKFINIYDSFKQFTYEQRNNAEMFRQQHFRPISFYVDGPVDYVGKVETFDQDMKSICSKLNVEYIVSEKINTSKHKHYTEYYDDETKEIVAEKYAKDIEYFRYKFGE